MIVATKHIRVYLLVLLVSLGAVGCIEQTYEQGIVHHVSIDLKSLNQYWIERGKPTDFKATEFIGSGEYFVFTNQINVAGSVYHCRFGVRRSDLPPGIVAITDKGVFLWINDKDGKVIVSPEKNGIRK